MANALLVYPKHPPTYWGADFVLGATGARSAFPPLGLLTVAAMFPPQYTLRVVDMNAPPPLRSASVAAIPDEFRYHEDGIEQAMASFRSVVTSQADASARQDSA